MKKYFSYLFFLVLVTVPSVIHACSCAHRTPGMAFNEAKAVFIGKMTGGTEKNTLKDSEGKEYTIESGKVGFTVEETFKGKLEKTVTVQVASMKGTSCGTYGLVPGETYVVYAYATKDEPIVFYTGVCTRTTNLAGEGAKPDLDFLRSLPPGGSGGRITGRVWLDTKASSGGAAKPLGGVGIRITGPPQKAITVVTDDEGNFDVTGLPEGTYRVTAKFPQNYYSDRNSEEVKLSDLGTASTGFEAYFKSWVSGQIFDADGVPYNEGFFHLENSTTRVYGHSEGNGGKFEVECVPPGDYKLYVEIRGGNDQDRKYYYPGTYDPASAKTITIGVGETKSGLRFTLPKEFRVRTIAGQVLWSNGTPAANVEVMLLCPQGAKDGFTVENFPPRVETDKNGRFTISAIAGTVYWLEARAVKNDEEYFHSPLNKMTVFKNLWNTKLVLSEIGLTDGCGDQPLN